MLYFNNANQFHHPRERLFCWTKIRSISGPKPWKPLKIVTNSESLNWFLSHWQLPHCISLCNMLDTVLLAWYFSPWSAIFSTVLSWLVLLHSIAGSNIFLSPERDKEMKINDKISSQSIKQNEQRTHGANQINLFLKSNPFSALAPHALSCTPLSPPPADYTLSLSLSCGPHVWRPF